MRPRSIDRAEILRGAVLGMEVLEASMRLRSIDRGSVLWLIAEKFVHKLQWGRDQMTAEMMQQTFLYAPLITLQCGGDQLDRGNAAQSLP